MAKSSGRPSRIWGKQKVNAPAPGRTGSADGGRKRAFRVIAGVVIAVILLLIPPCALRHCRRDPGMDGFTVVEQSVSRIIPAGETVSERKAVVKRKTAAPLSRRTKKIVKSKQVPKNAVSDIKPEPAPEKISRPAEPEKEAKRTEQERTIAAPAADKKKSTADSPFGKPKYYDFGTKIELDPPPVTR